MKDNKRDSYGVNSNHVGGEESLSLFVRRARFTNIIIPKMSPPTSTIKRRSPAEITDISGTPFINESTFRLNGRSKLRVQ